MLVYHITSQYIYILSQSGNPGKRVRVPASRRSAPPPLAGMAHPLTVPQKGYAKRSSNRQITNTSL